MQNCIKKAPPITEHQKTNIINIPNKTFNVNELEPFFTRSALKFADRETLYKYWHIAVESGVKRFITNVDNAFAENFPHE